MCVFQLDVYLIIPEMSVACNRSSYGLDAWHCVLLRAEGKRMWNLVRFGTGDPFNINIL